MITSPLYFTKQSYLLLHREYFELEWSIKDQYCNHWNYKKWVTKKTHILHKRLVQGMYMYIGKRVPMNERLTECTSRSTKYKINLLELILKKSNPKILSFFGTTCISHPLDEFEVNYRRKVVHVSYFLYSPKVGGECGKRGMKIFTSSKLLTFTGEFVWMKWTKWYLYHILQWWQGFYIFPRECRVLSTAK